jgi:diguanylate cyclase (GGDEF)-like protein/PAS domain S-box-containing protein
VLYIGENLALVESLLTINTSVNEFTLSQLLSVDTLMVKLESERFSFLISELPVSDLITQRITHHFPDLQCIYLANENKVKHVVLDSAINDADFNRDKPAQNTLKLSSSDVKSALDCIRIPIYYKNKAAKIVACNAGFAQIFGLLPDDIVGQSLDSILPKEVAIALKKSSLHNQSQQVQLLELEIQDARGAKREFLIREEISDCTQLQVGILFDVAEINAIKSTIEKERVMLRATADLSSDLIFFKDLESRFTGCNKQFEKFVGCPEADILGKKDDELFELNQARMCQAQDAKVIENDETYSNNEYLTYNNGEKHYIFMQKVPLKDKAGKVQGLVAIGRDITEKSTIQRQLKLAHVVFENSRDGILVTDGQGVVNTANDACISISGYTKEELINQKITLLTPGREYRRLFANIEHALKNNGKWQGNANFHSKTGELCYFWLDIYEVKHHESGLVNRVYSFTDLTQSKYNEEKIQYLSKHDSLTGLNNRIALFNSLEAAIARANYRQKSMGVIFVEIKGVKGINERYGHNQGDLAFREIAKRLKQSVFRKDFIARFGDDQFVIIVEELENEQLLALMAQRIANQFTDAINIDGVDVNLSLSIGISICPDDGIDLDTILANAETAMLRSKNDKSSIYHFYTNELTVNSTYQIKRENELRDAFKADQFEVYYQPQYDLNKRQVVAVESVLRWMHPEQGMILPENFLMLAEQSGLLITLGMKMFKKSAEQAVKWHNSGIHFGRIAINLSKLELTQSSLIGFVQKVLLDSGSKASWFEFEVDESLFSNDLYPIQDNLINLSRLGFSLTVSGFGAERSVLYCIDKLNIDKFKISKHLIQGVPGFLAGEAMLKSVFVLAQSLGIDVVSETIDSAPSGYSHPSQSLSMHKNKNIKEAMTATETTFYLKCYKRK